MRDLRLPVLAAALAGLVALPAGAGTLPFDDLREMLRAGFPEEVVLVLVEAEGAPSLTPAQWLELRALGASDRLLLALLRAPEGETQEAPGPGAASSESDGGGEAALWYRAFYRDEPDGGRVFVLTNLDEDGRRLGGEVARPAPRNRVVSPTRGGAAVEAEPGEEPARSREPEPLLVGPAPAAAFLAEYAPAPAAFVPVGPYYGFFFPYPLSHFYPPGSYTHLKLYHEPGRRGFGHYQLPAGQVFYGPPFPTAGYHAISGP
jgi:hypothetical protein